jgi:hypothetical protein
MGDWEGFFGLEENRKWGYVQKKEYKMIVSIINTMIIF